MKIIDLLNKIANGEIEDKRTFNIVFGNGLHRSIYYDKDEENCMCCLKNVSDDYSIYDDISFDTEIAIIEEEKKIPEKLENEHEFYSYTKYEKNKNEIDKVLYILKAINLTEDKIDNLNNSINSIIDYLKKENK